MVCGAGAQLAELDEVMAEQAAAVKAAHKLAATTRDQQDSMAEEMQLQLIKCASVAIPST